MTNKYFVKLSADALDDLGASLVWGMQNWGAERAGQWFDEMKEYIKLRLSTMPIAFPIAPESMEFDSEIRHLIVGRYRVLFRIKGRDVLVIRIVGSFIDQSERDP